MKIMQSCFSRVSQIKEQLEAIGDMVEEVEVVMTTLNGLPREWDYFIRGICARRKLTNFNKLWEECVHEEETIENIEEKLNDNEDQPLTIHAKNKRKSQGSPSRTTLDFKRGKKPRKDHSSFECYSCHKMGHITRNCPLRKYQFKKMN